jgi:hypothetical protein
MHCMPRDVYRGISGLTQLADKHGVSMEGVHGPLVAHLRANENFHVAIDTIAGAPARPRPRHTHAAMAGPGSWVLRPPGSWACPAFNPASGWATRARRQPPL